MQRLRDAGVRLRDFFFVPVSPLNVGVYRILLGSLTVVNGLLYWPLRFTWFGEGGVLPLADSYLVTSQGRLNLFEWLGPADAVVTAILALHIVAAALMTLGVFTRVSTAVAFVTLTSLHHRNVLVLNSGDTLTRVMLFCMIFAPAGRALSLDRWLRVRRGHEGPELAPQEPWAQRVMQVQLCLLYLSTAVAKSVGETWLDGTALYYASRLTEFRRLPLPFVPEHLWTIRVGTYFALLTEFALGLLVWFDTFRYPVLLAGILLHVGIDWSMNIPLFSWITMAPYVLFVRPNDLERGLGRLRAWRLPGGK